MNDLRSLIPLFEECQKLFEYDEKCETYSFKLQKERTINAIENLAHELLDINKIQYLATSKFKCIDNVIGVDIHDERNQKIVSLIYHPADNDLKFSAIINFTEILCYAEYKKDYELQTLNTIINKNAMSVSLNTDHMIIGYDSLFIALLNLKEIDVERCEINIKFHFDLNKSSMIILNRLLELKAIMNTPKKRHSFSHLIIY